MRVDAEAAASSWFVDPHSPAVVWGSFDTTPRSLRMRTLSAGVPGEPTLLMTYGEGILHFLISP